MHFYKSLLAFITLLDEDQFSRTHFSVYTIIFNRLFPFFTASVYVVIFIMPYVVAFFVFSHLNLFLIDQWIVFDVIWTVIYFAYITHWSWTIVRPGLDVEFHMRRIKYLFKSPRIKKCRIWFRRRISHSPNWTCEHGEHSDEQNKVDFFLLIASLSWR